MGYFYKAIDNVLKRMCNKRERNSSGISYDSIKMLSRMYEEKSKLLLLSLAPVLELTKNSPAFSR